MTSRASVSTGVKVTLGAIGLLLALWLGARLQSLLVLLLLATTLATGIYPVVEWLETRTLPFRGWRIPRSLAILSTLLTAVAAVLGLFYFLGSVLWTESSQAWNDLPFYIDGLKDGLTYLREKFPAIPPTPELATRAQEQIGRVSDYLWQTTSALLGMLGLLGSALTMLVLVFYMLLEGKNCSQLCFPSSRPAIKKRLPTPPQRHCGRWAAGCGGRRFSCFW